MTPADRRIDKRPRMRFLTRKAPDAQEETMNPASLDITPLSEACGARIGGVDLNALT